MIEIIPNIVSRIKFENAYFSKENQDVFDEEQLNNGIDGGNQSNDVPVLIDNSSTEGMNSNFNADVIIIPRIIEETTVNTCFYVKFYHINILFSIICLKDLSIIINLDFKIVLEKQNRGENLTGNDLTIIAQSIIKYLLEDDHNRM